MKHTQETPQQRLERQTAKLEAMRYGKRPKGRLGLKKFRHKQMNLALSTSFLKRVMHEMFSPPSEVHYFREGGLETINKECGEVVLPRVHPKLSGMEYSLGFIHPYSSNPDNLEQWPKIMFPISG